ncbi:MAG: hypothetical protein QXQ39_04850 [Conexivisphaerales archaeon]
MRHTLLLLFINILIVASSFSTLAAAQQQPISGSGQFGFSVSQSIAVDRFGWVFLNTTLTFSNSSAVSIPPAVPVSIVYPGYVYSSLWSYNETGMDVKPSYNNNGTVFTGTVFTVGHPSLSIRLNGAIQETITGVYNIQVFSIPDVKVTGGNETKATSMITLPSSQFVSVINPATLASYNFTSQPSVNQLWSYTYGNVTKFVPFSFNLSFVSQGTSDFAIYRILSIERTVEFTSNGGFMVTDSVTIMNLDTTELSSIYLTQPLTGTFYVGQGLIHPSPTSLSQGVLNLPSPIPYNSVSTLVIQYTLPKDDLSYSSGRVRISLDQGIPSYVNYIQKYSVDYSFPEGSSAEFLTPSSFYNITALPSVELTASIPWSWGIRPTLAVAFGAAIIFIAVYLVLVRKKKGSEVEEIISRKKAIILGLLDDIRLRGEGFIPYAYYSDQRKLLESERSEISSKINDFRNRAKKDKSLRQATDKLTNEDAKIEQAYKEARLLLEERVAGRVTVEQFKQKVDSLKKSLGMEE